MPSESKEKKDYRRVDNDELKKFESDYQVVEFTEEDRKDILNKFEKDLWVEHYPGFKHLNPRFLNLNIDLKYLTPWHSRLKVHLKITRHQDDWIVVVLKYHDTWFGSSSMHSQQTLAYFICDEIDGLDSFLNDMSVNDKKLFPKWLENNIRHKN